MVDKKLVDSIQKDYRRNADSYRMAKQYGDHSHSGFPAISYVLVLVIFVGMAVLV